jgi:hypothetical protein
MRIWVRMLWVLVTLTWVGSAQALPPTKAGACRREVIEGELNAGRDFSQAIGNGLRVWFQAIHSGWILRVEPASGPVGEHDYAELATPPYQSVTPLSISTDFAFRAQDAVGWNPRRFRFATTAAMFHGLEQAYRKFEAAGANPPDALQAEVAREIGQTSEGTFTILDSRLVQGTADQWRMAAPVASHFASTAHTLVVEPDGSTSALGRLVWLRFRLELDLPAGFQANPNLHMVPRICGNP